METMKIREYISSEEAESRGCDGKDEGGYYRMVPVPVISDKLRKRMRRCAGCHDDFYNNRANCCGNTCWSLKRDDNFRGRGKPACYH